MKKYKTELHCHTGDVSNCAEETAEYIVSRYLEAGYTSLVVTNHMSASTFHSPKYQKYLEKSGKSDLWQTKIDFFMTGYENMISAAKGRLHILLGMEFCSFISPPNDYLVYGVCEKWLRENDAIPEMKIKEMSQCVHQAGMMIFQAHPFRNDMRITDPKYLDGVEVYNGHIFHKSRNSIAQAWADFHHLKGTSGSDFHESRHGCCGGIVTEFPIETNEQLLAVLQSGSYELIRDYDFGRSE